MIQPKRPRRWALSLVVATGLLSLALLPFWVDLHVLSPRSDVGSWRLEGSGNADGDHSTWVRVSDSDGEPLADSLVRVLGPGGSLLTAVTTDDAGLAIARWHGPVMSSIVASHPTWGTATTAPSSRAIGSTINIQYQALSTIHVTASCDQHRPGRTHRIMLTHKHTNRTTHRELRSDARDVSVEELPPGCYDVSLWCSSDHKSVEVCIPRNGLSESVSLSLRRGGSSPPLNGRRDHVLRIAGQALLRKTQEPLVNVRLALRGQYDSGQVVTAEALTDAEGHFSTGLLRSGGKLSLGLKVEGFLPEHTVLTNEEPSTELIVAFDPDEAVRELLITSAGGFPVAGALVEYRSMQLDGSLRAKKAVSSSDGIVLIAKDSPEQLGVAVPILTSGRIGSEIQYNRERLRVGGDTATVSHNVLNVVLLDESNAFVDGTFRWLWIDAGGAQSSGFLKVESHVLSVLTPTKQGRVEILGTGVWPLSGRSWVAYAASDVDLVRDLDVVVTIAEQERIEIETDPEVHAAGSWFEGRVLNADHGSLLATIQWCFEWEGRHFVTGCGIDDIEMVVISSHGVAVVGERERRSKRVRLQSDGWVFGKVVGADTSASKCATVVATLEGGRELRSRVYDSGTFVIDCEDTDSVIRVTGIDESGAQLAEAKGTLLGSLELVLPED
jgi:hypothetical protein